MSRKRSHNQKSRGPVAVSRRKRIVILATTLALTLTGVITAQRASLRALVGSVVTPTPPPAAPAAPQSSTPAKEYIYAGGKLVATQQLEAGGGCSYLLSPSSQSFAASGGTDSFNVNSGTGCAWNATSNATWITITSGASGSGIGTVNYSVASNGSASQRTGTITVENQIFTVTQAGTGGGCSYSINPSSNSFASSGGTGSVSVTAGAGCNWIAASNDGWITITSGASGSGNGTVGYSVASNGTASQRTGTMTIAGQTFTVTQAGSGGSCTYSINPTLENFVSAGGTGQVSVTTQAGCAWTAVSNDFWITVTSGSSGTGSGTVDYSVSQNISVGRTGTITIAGQTLTVTQDSGCSYVVTPSSQSFTASGGTGSFTVSAGSGCTWTASTTDSWITITSGSSGTAGGSVNYSVAANPGGPRSGTITVAGLPRTVTQSGGAGTCQVSNFAGTGTAGYGEGTANNSKWDSPNAGVVAKDPQTGRYSLFIADTENHRIRLVYLEVETGKSAFIAGNSTAGYAEGTGLAARFRFPRGIAAITDAQGIVTTLLVADTDNHCIRKLTYSSGSWTSAIFSGKGGSSGLINGSASASRYNAPRGIVSSPDGSVYVADTGNAKIRKLTQTGTSTTLATTGGINTPLGITVATTNNMLFVSDSVRHIVWQVNPSTGAGTWLAGGDVAGFADGTGTAARFNLPAHLAWANTAGGEVVYIADRNNNRIRKLVISSGATTTYAGTGVAGFADGACDVAKFNLPYGVAMQAGGALYVIDTENNRIRKIE